MTVKIDESGRRSIQVEVEVPGTPEEVWQAIATGPGISCWFVPTELEEREGGRMVLHFGPGMDSTATITTWDPPHRLAAGGDGFAPGAPPLATEWTIEAQRGGTCLVRVVHSLFASNEDWDNQLADTEEGWPTFFRILALYLEHFRGERSANVSLMAMASGEVAKVWETVTGTLGLGNPAAGERCATSGAGVPPLAGVVEPLAEIGHGHRLLLRLDEPTPGFAMLGAFKCGGAAMATVTLYLYGDRAAEVAARDEPVWQAWIDEHFPAAAGSAV